MNKRKLTSSQMAAFEQYFFLEARCTETIEKYLRDVHALASWANGQGLTHELILAWKEHLIDTNYAPSTINRLALVQYKIGGKNMKRNTKRFLSLLLTLCLMLSLLPK